MKSVIATVVGTNNFGQFVCKSRNGVKLPLHPPHVLLFPTREQLELADRYNRIEVGNKIKVSRTRIGSYKLV